MASFWMEGRQCGRLPPTVTGPIVTFLRPLARVRQCLPPPAGLGVAPMFAAYNEYDTYEEYGAFTTHRYNAQNGTRASDAGEIFGFVAVTSFSLGLRLFQSRCCIISKSRFCHKPLCCQRPSGPVAGIPARVHRYGQHDHPLWNPEPSPGGRPLHARAPRGHG